jgi:hypothetical protein
LQLEHGDQQQQPGSIGRKLIAALSCFRLPRQECLSIARLNLAWFVAAAAVGAGRRCRPCPPCRSKLRAPALV